MKKSPVEIQTQKQAKIKQYNPDSVGTYNGNLYGLPFTPEESEVIIVPVPWEATVSYRGGTSDGPEAILQASPQLDLYDSELPNAWQMGIAMLPIPLQWKELNAICRKKARVCIEILESGGDPQNESVQLLSRYVNDTCRSLHQWVEQTCLEHLNEGKIVGVLGGEHSVALGIIRAMARKYDNFGILQIDAHADLRDSYEGFEYSHASIMFNALKVPQISRLVQVGIRDFCKSEANLVNDSKERIHIHEDRRIKRELFAGASWKELCERMIEPLPKEVYISFDIDGLSPEMCPHTGTPVPGGLSFEEAFYLIETVVQSGRSIIGFDLCEVSLGEDGSDDWDAIVGARVLYRLANLAGKSQGRLS